MDDVRRKAPKYANLLRNQILPARKSARTDSINVVGFSDGSLHNGEAGAATLLQVDVAGAPSFIARLHLGKYVYNSPQAECSGAILTLRCVDVLREEGLYVGSVEVASDCIGVCDVISGKMKIRENLYPCFLELSRVVKDFRERNPTVHVSSRHTPKKEEILGNVRADAEAKEASRGRTSVSIVLNGQTNTK